MTLRRLRRAGPVGRPAAPVRLAHLGLGNFFRAHQAWYTEHSADGPDWGIAAFGGRGGEAAALLQAQDGLYTLVTREPTGDHMETVSSISKAYPAGDSEAWLCTLADPAVVAVTATVTEAGWHGSGRGGLDVGHPEVISDVEALRAGQPGSVGSAPGRLVAGLAARWQGGAPPLTVIPCDNIPGNGPLVRRVLTELADLVDSNLAQWIDTQVGVVGCVVDRITPRTVDSDRLAVAEATGFDDRSPVVTEPFSEWIMSGTFVLGRPKWESAGVRLVDDLEPYEHRKLRLLNGGHSLLAYFGLARGHTTVVEALGDEMCAEWLHRWWGEAARHLAQPAEEIEGYTNQLLRRLANPRLADRLLRIAEDGSQKLPIRVLPVLRLERLADRTAEAAAAVLAAWILHLRSGRKVADPRAAELVALAAGPPESAVPAVLGALDPALAEVVAVAELVREQFALFA